MSAALGYQNGRDGSGRLRGPPQAEDWAPSGFRQPHRSYTSSRRWHQLKSRLCNIPWRDVRRWGYVRLDGDEESMSKRPAKGQVRIDYFIYSLLATLWRRRRSSVFMRIILRPIVLLILIVFFVVSFTSREFGHLGQRNFDVFDYIDPLIGTTNGGLLRNCLLSVSP